MRWYACDEQIWFWSIGSLVLILSSWANIQFSAEAAYQTKDAAQSKAADLNNATNDSETYTDKASNTAIAAKDKMANTLGLNQPSTGPSVLDKAKEYWGSAVGATTGTAQSAVDTTKDKAYQAKDAAADTTGSATDTSKDNAGSAADTTKDYATSAKDTTADKTGSAVDTAKDYATSAKDTTADNTSSAADTAKDYAYSAKDTTADNAGEFRVWGASNWWLNNVNLWSCRYSFFVNYIWKRR